MKNYLYLVLISSFISLQGQNFIINGKFSKPFNENYEKAYTLEALITTNNNAYSIGVFLGFSDIQLNADGYNWLYSTDYDMTKGIRGLITYIYPLSQTNYVFLKPIYLSLTWAKISDMTGSGSANHVFDETGYLFPNSRNENIWGFSSGYKINLGIVNILLSVGYQYREYDLEFDEYDNGDYVERHIIHQLEKSVQIDIALQYIFQ